jgi:hypothetical protein
MSIGTRKKIVGLITGGTLTLLGVFLPVDGVSAATLKGLLNKDFWVGIGGEALYDKLLSPVLGQLPGFTENTSLVESAFRGIGVETFIAAGGGAFYTNNNGRIADNDIAAVAYASSQRTSKRMSGSFQIRGTSAQNAPYFVRLTSVVGETGRGLFPVFDYTDVNVNGFTLNTGTARLTNEQMYAGGFSIAYIAGKFEAIGLNFRTGAMKTQPEPVPEPLTFFGTAVGLGLGAFFKKEYSRKQEKLKSLKKQKA